jgi:Ankyrin repeats (3 copies)
MSSSSGGGGDSTKLAEAFEFLSAAGAEAQIEEILSGELHCGNGEQDYFERAHRMNETLISELHDAAALGIVEQLEYLIGAGECVDSLDSAKNTPLHYAASSNQVEAMRYLVSRGANVNAVNALGDRPLHRSCWRNCFEATEYLLSIGIIDEACQNNDGKRPTDLIRQSRIAYLFAAQLDSDDEWPSSDGEQFNEATVVESATDSK